MRTEISHEKAAPEQVKQWWAAFKDKCDDDSRNRLIEYYFSIVKYTAERVCAKLPDSVDVDDLISSGTWGLMDAIKAFDLNRGVKFETYCSRRIRGAILDELRALDWVPRIVRSRANKLNGATAFLEASLGRKPNEKELARQLKLPLRKFRRLQRDASATTFVSVIRKWSGADSYKDICVIDILEDQSRENPVRLAQRKNLRELLTRGLSRADRLIVILYYYEKMTMKEIGKTVGLSESRISQRHSAILDRLRGKLRTRYPDRGELLP